MGREVICKWKLFMFRAGYSEGNNQQRRITEDYWCMVSSIENYSETVRTCGQAFKVCSTKVTKKKSRLPVFPPVVSNQAGCLIWWRFEVSVWIGTSPSDLQPPRDFPQPSSSSLTTLLHPVKTLVLVWAGKDTAPPDLQEKSNPQLLLCLWMSGCSIT